MNSLSQALPWHDLLFSSKLAKWSGYCYYPQEQLPKLVEASAAGTRPAKLTTHKRKTAATSLLLVLCPCRLKA